MSLSQALTLVGLFAVLVHAILLSRYVVQREPATSAYAPWVIFFSGMWFVGPFTWLAFRRSRPLLARACLQQLAVLTAFWLVAIAFLQDGR